MKLGIKFQFLLPAAVILFGVIWTGVLDYSTTTLNSTKKRIPGSGGLWQLFLGYVICACIWRNYWAWNDAKKGKITTLDAEFISVHNTFTLAQLVAEMVEYHLSVHMENNEVLIQRVQALSEWSIFLFLAWVVIWGRHLRRGWDAQHNWFIYLAALLAYFPASIHHTSFLFFLAIGITLSCIALYETYKVHYFRPNVKTLFYSILCLTILFFILRVVAYVLPGFGWIWTYMYVAVFALVAALTNRMYIRILREVNEHKY